MFSLIISIIAIALVVVLAGASLYYGGDAFTQGSSKAQAATYVNQAQQIAAAITLHKVEQGSFSALADLTTNGYMSTLPVAPEGPWVYTSADGTLTAPVDAAGDVCAKITEQQASSGGPFGCAVVGADATFTYHLDGAP